MIPKGPARIFYRIVAGVLVVVFTWYDISWGGTLAEDIAATQSSQGLMTPVDLVGSHGVVQSAVDIKNSIEDYSVSNNETKTLGAESGTPTYTYYSNGRMQSQTLAAPDSQGMIYYHYINENWQGQGYGRFDKAVRQTPVDGELAYRYMYYGDSSGRLYVKYSYPDTSCAYPSMCYMYKNDQYNRLYQRYDYTNKITYTYYNDANNRMNARTLSTPDANGVIYYSYLNEDWNGQGYGRVAKTRLNTADADGCLSYYYSYNTDATGRIKYKKSYSDNNWTTHVATRYYNNNSSSNLYSLYEASTGNTFYYYNDASNRLAYKNLKTPDAQGMSYYHYRNEDWQGQGYGRVDQSKRSVASSEGELSYKYTYNADSTGYLKSKTSYVTASFGTLLFIYSYSNNGANYLLAKTSYCYIKDAAGVAQRKTRQSLTYDATGTVVVKQYDYTYFGEDTVNYPGNIFPATLSYITRDAATGDITRNEFTEYYSSNGYAKNKHVMTFDAATGAVTANTRYDYMDTVSGRALTYTVYKKDTANTIATQTAYCYVKNSTGVDQKKTRQSLTYDATGAIVVTQYDYTYFGENQNAGDPYYGNLFTASKVTITHDPTTGLVKASNKYEYSPDISGRQLIYTVYKAGTTDVISTKTSYCYVKDAAGVEKQKTRQSLTYNADGTVAVKEYNYTYFGEDAINYPGNMVVAASTNIVRDSTTGKTTSIIDYLYSSSESGCYANSYQYRVNADGSRGSLWKAAEYIYLDTNAKTKTLLTYNSAGTTVTQKDEYTYDIGTKSTNWKKTTLYRSADGTRSKEIEYVYFGTTAKTVRVTTYGADGIVLLKDESWVYYSADAVSLHKVIDNQANTVTEEAYAPDGTNTVTITSTLLKTVSDYDIEGYITGYKEYAVPTDALTAERTYYDHGKLKSEKLYDVNGYVISFEQYYSNGISIELSDSWEYYPDYSLKMHTSIFKSPPLDIMNIIRTIDAYEIDGSMTRTVTSSIHNILSKAVTVYDASGIMRSYTEYGMPSNVPALERTYYDDSTLKSEKIYNAEGDPVTYKEYDADGETLIKDAIWEYYPGGGESYTERGDFFNNDQSLPGYEYTYTSDGFTTTFVQRLNFEYYADGDLHTKTVLRTPSEPKQVYEYDEGTGNLIKYAEKHVGDDSLIMEIAYYNTPEAIPHYQWLVADLEDGVSDVYREFDLLGRLVKSVANNGYYRLYDGYFGDTSYAEYIREYDPQDTLRFTHIFDNAGVLLSTAFSGSNTYYYQGGALARVETLDGLTIDCGTDDPQATYTDEAVYGDRLSISVGGTAIGYIVIKDGYIWETSLLSGYAASIVDGELFIRDANGALLGHDYGGYTANMGTYYQPDGYSNEEWYGLVEWGGPEDGEDPLPRQAYYSMQDAYTAMVSPKMPYGSNISQRPGRGVVVTDGSLGNSLGYWSGIGVSGSQVSNWPDTPGLKSMEAVNKRELKFTWNNPAASAKWFSTNIGPDPNGFDASQYKYVMLRVKGAAGGETFKVQLQDHIVHYQETTIVNIASYATITTEYQDIYIPLSDFRTDPAHLNLSYLLSVSLLFRDVTSGVQTIYVDQIKLVKDDAVTSPKGVSTGPVTISGNQIYVDGDPFEIKGVGYSRHDASTYDRDLELIEAMGANTIRTWGEVDQAMLDSAASHGIKVAAGFWINYDADLDPASPGNTRDAIKAQFLNYVTQFKDHPGLLMWSIGNENNLHLNTAEQANFYSLCNELAQIAYQQEGQNYHPVAIVNSGYQNIGVSANGTTDEQLSYIDVWGDNRYSQQSFYYYEDYFNRYESRTDKPLFITEYGVDAWHSNSISNPKSGYEDEAIQASWDSAFASEIYNSDVCLGGSVFMFSDDWTKTDTQSALTTSSAFAYTRRTFGDGTIQMFDKNGNLVDTIPADGIKRYYDYQARCVREVYNDNSYADLIYEDCALYRTIVFDADGSYEEYDAGGTLLYSYDPATFGSDSTPGLVSVTTPDGTIIYYDNQGAVKHVVMPDGVELFDVVLDENNDLKDGVVRLPDGTIFLVRGLEAVQVIRTNGAIYRFADGLLQSEVSAGELTVYNHEKDGSGALVKTTAENSSTKAVYDAAGSLKYSVNDDGSGMLYEDGIVRAVFTGGGMAYLYDKRAESSGGVSSTIADLAGVITGAGEILDKADSRVDSSLPVLLRYDDTVALVGMARIDGSVLTPGSSGINISGAGTGGNYAFSFDEFNCVKDITVSRDSLIRSYNNEGSLTSLLKEDGTLLRFTDNRLSLVETPEGVTLKNIITDDSGAVTGYDVVESDGSLTSYMNGVIYRKERPDGTIIRYLDGKVDRVEEPDGKVYKYNYEYDTGVVTKTTKELISYRLSDGTILELLGGVIKTLRLSDGAVITDPVFDDAGMLTSGNIDLGNGITGEISAGKLARMILEDGSTELYYSDGRLAHAVRDGEPVFDYEYLTDIAGNITGTIVHTAHGKMHYNADGVLTSFEENGYEVIYEDGTIDRISLAELGIVIEDPVFDAQNRLDEGVVTLSDGSVYTFDNCVPVSFITPEGASIAYDAYGSIRSIIKDGDRKEFLYSRQSNGDITAISIQYTRDGAIVMDDLMAYLKSVATDSEELVVNRLPYNLFDSPSYTLSSSCNAGSISLVDHRFTDPLPDPLAKFEASYTVTSSTTSMQVSGTIDFGTEDYLDLIVGIGIKKDASVTQALPVNITFYKGSQLVYTYSLGDLTTDWTYKTIAIPASVGLRPDSFKVQVVTSGITPHTGKFYLSEVIPLQVKTLRPDDKTWTGNLLPAASVAGYLGAPAENIYSAYADPSGFFSPVDISGYYGATPLIVEYTGTDTLTRITRTNGSVLDYTNKRPVTMTESDGRIVEYTYSGPYVSSARIFPENGLLDPEIVLEYEANRIKKATKDDVIYSYTYEEDANGREVVAIKNGSTGDVYRYRDELLISATTSDGLVTEYSYLSGRIVSSCVKLQDKLMEAFLYSYADDLTIVIDEKGVSRTYDKNNLLIYLETADGLGYQYNYFKDDQGNDIVEVELYQAEGKDGIIVYHKDGAVDHVQLKDGTIININDTPGVDSLQGMTVKDGLVESVTYNTGEVAYYERNDRDEISSIRVEKDGITRWYDPDGKLYKLQSSPGEYYLYTYTWNPNGSINDIKVSRVTYETIGAGVPPVKLYTYSAGYLNGWDAGTFVDDTGVSSFNTNWWWTRRDESWTGRGYDVVVVDQASGEVKARDIFDTYGKGASEANRMASFIGSVAEGDYVIIAIGDDGYTNMTEAAYQAIEGIGSSEIRNVGFRDSWAIIGRKGAPAGTVVEEHKAVGSGAVVLSGYSVETSYYDKDGTPISFSQYSPVFSSSWYSQRPTNTMPDMEVLSVNSRGDAVGYIKNFNSCYANSGLIRIWDCKPEYGSFATQARMEELDGFLTAAGKTQAKAVYFDERYPVSWSTWAEAGFIKDYFSARGYEVVDANTLRTWLKTNGPDSVLIMAQDVAPSTILNKYTSDNLMRGYLEEGGTVVWPRDMPFYYVGYADGTKSEIGENGQRKYLGITASIEPRKDGENRYTYGTCTIPVFTVPAGAQALDTSILYFDVSVNYRDIDWHKVQASIGYELEEDTAVSSVYDEDGKIISIAKADQTVSVYNEYGKIDFVCDIHDDIISQYEYDAEGDILKITLERERHDLEFEIEDAENLIEEEEAYQLAQVAEQMNIVVAYIHNQFEAARAPLRAQRASLVNQLRDREDDVCWFGWGKKEKNRDCDQLRGAIGLVDRQIAELYAQESEQIALASDPVTGEVRRLKDDIEANAQNAIDDIKAKRLELLEQISVNEAVPVIHDYYRTILGRDPGTDELQRWVNAVAASPTDTLDIAALKAELQDAAADSEYTKRTALRDRISSDIQAILTQYLAKTDEEKEAFLASLGLESSEIIVFTSDDIVDIVSWLGSQNVHFARSAATIISELLKGTPSAIDLDSDDYRVLIQNAILVDILTGTINKFTEGDLYISAYAISKVASLYGITLNTAQLTFAELVSEVAANKTPVFVDGNHYIVVLSIDEAAGTVTYHEPSKGEFGETVTATIDQFKEMWKEGYALTQNTPERSGALLTDYEAQKIRGACFFGLEWIIYGLISMAIAAINIIVNAVIVIVQSVIIPLITQALGAVVTFFQGLAAGVAYIGKALFLGLKFIGLTLYKGFTGFVAGIGSIFAAPSAGSAVGAVSSPFMTFIGQSVVGIATNFIVNAGCEILGIDPSFANMVSSFISGGIIGGMGSASGFFFNFSQAISQAVLTGINMVGLEFNLPPILTNIVSTLMSIPMGDIWLPAGDLNTAIALSLGAELFSQGLDYAVDMFDLDPSIKSLLKLGVRTGINVGFQIFNDPGSTFGDWWNTIVDELTKPSNLAIAFNIAGDFIDLPPLLNNIVITAVLGAIDGFIENPQDRIGGVFSGIFNHFLRTGLRAATLGLYDPETGTLVENWQAGYYVNSLISFISVVQQSGIEAGLEYYLAGIFRDDAIRIINEAGGIRDILTGHAEMVQENGIWFKKINISDTDKLYLDPNNDDILGRDYGSIRERGHYGIDPVTGAFGLTDGTFEEIGDNGVRTVYYVRDALIIDKIQMYDETGGYIEFLPTDIETGLRISSDGMPVSAVVKSFDADLTFRYEYIDDSIYLQFNVKDVDASNGTSSINLSNISNAEKQEIFNYYMLANGINNMNPYGTPGYMDGFVMDLTNASPGAEDFTFIPLFNEFYGKISSANFEILYHDPIYAALIFQDLLSFGYIDSEGKILPAFLNIKNPSNFIMSSQFDGIKDDVYQVLWSSCQHAAEDVVKWFQDVQGDSDEITNKIIERIQGEFAGNYPVDMVGVCYSGAGDPFIQAINQKVFNGSYLDVEALVLVGTPLKKYYRLGLWENREIINSNVNTVVTIQGQWDFFRPADHNFAGSLSVDNEFKIIIKDAWHTDYFYDPNNPSKNDDFKRKVSRFIAEVTARSKDSILLANFLDRPGIKIVNGKYVVDVNEVTYDH